MSFSAQVKAAAALWAVNPDECVAKLSALKPDNAIDAVNLHRSLVVHNEWLARLKAGLPPYHSLSISDLGFHFTDLGPYWKAAQESGSAMDIAFCLFLARKIGASEPLFRIFEAKGHVAGTVRLKADFHASLDHIDPSISFVPVDFHNEAKGTGPIIYLACDVRYLAFALPMIRSLYAVAPDVACHLHVFTEGGKPLGLDGRLPEGCGLSTERVPGAGKGYFHAARFIRLHEFMIRHDRPVWLMDVDALFNAHPGSLLETLDGCDVALRARPGRLEPWNQINACVVGFNNNPAALKYLRGIAQFIHYFRNFLAWGIDQNAMLCVFEQQKPRVACLGEKFIDYDYVADGVVWANSSNIKKAHLMALTDPTVKVERPVYFEKFRQFSWSA